MPTDEHTVVVRQVPAASRCRLPAGRFAEGRRKIVVRAARTFPAETIDVERSGRLTTSGSVEWMATFRRAPGAK